MDIMIFILDLGIIKHAVKYTSCKHGVMLPVTHTWPGGYRARREAEGLKDRIKRKKDELADTTRELNALFLVHRHNQLPAMRASSVLICLCSRKLAHSICTPFHPIDHILHQAASWVCLPVCLLQSAPKPMTTLSLVPCLSRSRQSLTKYRPYANDDVFQQCAPCRSSRTTQSPETS